MNQQRNQNNTLANWLAKRLDKCLSIDEWQRTSLEQLLQRLRNER